MNKCLCQWNVEHINGSCYEELVVINTKCPIHGITYGNKKELV